MFRHRPTLGTTQWGDGCNDNREHFKEWGENEDQRGEWWYTSGTGANASIELTNEFGAPEGYGCHVAKLSTGDPGASPEDNQARVQSLSKFNDGRLMDVTAMRYRTYRSSESSSDDRVTAAMSVAVISIFAKDLATWLHYEPHRQGGGS